MPPITTNSDPTDLWPKTPLFIEQSSVSALSHHDPSSAGFTTNIAESNIWYAQGFGQSEAGWIAPELLRLRGELLLSQGAPAAAETAESLFRQALDEARQQEALSWELRTATSLARLLSNQGHPSDAIACLEPVYRRFTEGFGTADLIAAKQLLDGLSDAGRR